MIGLAYFIVLAHVLTKQEMGAYTLLSFVLALIPVVGSFALPSAAIKYISQYLAVNDHEKAKGVVSRVLQVGVASSVIAFLVLFIPAEELGIAIFGITGYGLLLRMLALSTIFAVLNVQTLSFLQGMQKMWQVAVLGAGYTLTQALLSISLLLLGWGLVSVVLGWLIGLAIISAIGLILTYKGLGVARRPYPIKPLLDFSFPLYISGTFSFLVTWVDQLLLAALLGQETLGVYSVAIRAAAVPGLFATSIVTVLFPKLSELHTKQGLSSLESAFKVSTRYSVLIGFPLIVGLATLAYPMVILFGGMQYVGAVEPLIIICMAALATAFGVAISSILLTLERTRIVSLLSIISVGLSFLLSYIALVQLGLGMVGTAWARTFAAVAALGLNLYALSRYISISIDKEALWKASLACVVLIVAILGLDFGRMLFSSEPYQFLVFRLRVLPVYVVVAGLAYFLALVVLRAIRTEDVRLVEEYLPKRLRRVALWLERIAVTD